MAKDWSKPVRILRWCFYQRYAYTDSEFDSNSLSVKCTQCTLGVRADGEGGPTLAATAAISQAVNIPTMAASGISSVTAPLAIAAGASGVGVGSAVNKLNSDIAMLQDGFARVL
jgi:hypothetical protein